MYKEWNIPLKNYLKEFANKQIFITGCNEILKKYNSELKELCKPSMRKYYISGHSAVPVDLLIELSKTHKTIIAECFKFCKGFSSRAASPVILPKEITYDLAYLLGTLRDGSITRHDYSLRITQNGKGAYEWLLGINRIIKKLFGVSARFSKIRNENRIDIQSKPIVIFFRKIFEMPFNQSEWSTPKLIEKYKESWMPYVSGFFDAEGYCTSEKTFRKTGKIKVAFFQNNKNAISFIKRVLEFYKIKTGDLYLEKNRNCFSLYIQSKNGIEKFGNIFNPVRKKIQLLELLKVIKDT